MTTTEIAEARRLIRPILTHELAICRAVYAPSDRMAEIEHIQRAIETFDRMVLALSAASAQPDQGEHIGLAVAVPVEA